MQLTVDFRLEPLRYFSSVNRIDSTVINYMPFIRNDLEIWRKMHRNVGFYHIFLVMSHVFFYQKNLMQN